MDLASTPAWVKDAVFYQIFPDRFANSDPSNDPPNVQPWGSPPTTWGFQGGDLQGIIDRFDYLIDLGINAIYLNPIFQSPSNHRYNTLDYFRIEPMLGDLSTFKQLIDSAHRRGVRVILDGVFNHCGRGFFAFSDILENRENSPYRDWFHVRRYPPDAYSPGDSQDYLAWWGIKSLPKFNTRNPTVRRYLLSVARYWIEQGVDGWRLDVPNEIDDDSFWAEFRYEVRRVNPEAYLLGEIWNADQRWVGSSHFDGLMNYPLRDALLRFLQAKTYCASEFGCKVDELLQTYPAAYNDAMYNLLGSHDTERILTKVEGSLPLTRLAFLFLFTFPGAPAIYYGDEIGITGGKDPDCRAAFPWDGKHWDHSLREYVKNLVSLRKRVEPLRAGLFRWLLQDDDQSTAAYARSMDHQHVVVVLNAGDRPSQVRVPVGDLGLGDGSELKDLLSKKKYAVSARKLELSLAGYEGVILISASSSERRQSDLL
jgi:glycosidase